MRYALLNPILDKLVREGKIEIAAGKDRDMVSLSRQEQEVDKEEGNFGHFLFAYKKWINWEEGNHFGHFLFMYDNGVWT